MYDAERAMAWEELVWDAASERVNCRTNLFENLVNFLGLFDFGLVRFGHDVAGVGKGGTFS